MRGILRMIPSSYGGANPFVFDSVNDLAFSVRKVNSAYIGNCMRIRRSSDNTELEIGFVGGELDTSAISTFCGAGFGYVAKWYDQSGNTQDKLNTTAINQPVIYNNGFTLRNGKPYISASSTQWLYFPAVKVVTGDITFFMTYEKLSAGNVPMLLDGSNNYTWLDYGVSQVYSTSYANTISPTFAINTLYLHNGITLSNNVKTFQNNTLVGERVGVRTGGSFLRMLPSGLFRTPTVLFSEFIFYKSDKTATAIDMRNDINNYYSIF